MSKYEIIFDDGSGGVKGAVLLDDVQRVSQHKKFQVMHMENTKVYIMRNKIWGCKKLNEEPESVLDEFEHFLSGFCPSVERRKANANMAQDTSRDTDNLLSGSVVDMLSKRSFQICR